MITDMKIVIELLNPILELGSGFQQYRYPICFYLPYIDMHNLSEGKGDSTNIIRY